MDETKNNDLVFKKITDINKLQNYLKIAVYSKKEATLTYSKSKDYVKVILKSPDTNIVKVEKTKEITAILELADKDGSNVFIQFNTPKMLVFFVIDKYTKETEDLTKIENYVLHIRNDFFQTNRRKYPRIPFDNQFNIEKKITMLNPTPNPEKGKEVLELTLIDLSVNGLSFAFTKDEAEFFSKHQKLENISFTVRNRSFSTNGVIRWIKGTRAGIQFVGFNKRELLNYYLDHIMRAFFKEVYYLETG